MLRFYLNILYSGQILEECIGEGVEFSNENVSLFEYPTNTIIFLNSVKDIQNHYSSVGKTSIEWLDFNDFDKNIN